MVGKHAIRVALTRTAVASWARYFSYVKAIEEDLGKDAPEMIRAKLKKEKEIHEAQLKGALGAISTLARYFEVTLAQKEVLKAKGLQKYETEERRDELEHRRAK